MVVPGGTPVIVGEPTCVTVSPIPAAVRGGLRSWSAEPESWRV